MNDNDFRKLIDREREKIGNTAFNKRRAKQVADKYITADGKPPPESEDVSDVAPDAETEELEAQDGAVLLGDVEAFLGRFVVYPSEHAKVAHVLWIAHAHLMDRWDSTPRLAFLSPEPASGKTRALEVTALLVPAPVEAVNVSPAYLFRKVGEDGAGCTILFDEIDTVFGPKAKENEEIRGLLNAGHRQGAVAGRCVVHGKTVLTEEISAYCAVALAGLGWLPDTILSRSIIICRRKPGEKIVSFRRRLEIKAGSNLNGRLAAWAKQVGRAIKWPEMPAGIEDRDADVWEALLSVADAAGGIWPSRAVKAALALVKEAQDREPSLGVRLLADLKTIFGGEDHVFTEVILATLHGMTEAPWNDLKGRPLNDRGLATRLRQYGIKSKQVRIGEVTRKGYSRDDFYDAWQRYLPPPEPKKSETNETTKTEAENANGISAETVSDGEKAAETGPFASETSIAGVSDSHCNVSDDVSDRWPEKASAIKGVSCVSDVSLGRAEDRDPDLDIPPALDRRPRCAQCNGTPDGSERLSDEVNGQPMWLHDQCRKFYRSDGWRFGFGTTSPMAFMGSSL
jgi:hypothetical protein